MDKIKIEREFEENTASYERYATITLKRDGIKNLKITFGGNLDLYFILNNFDKDPTFYIGIDNYGLYHIFDTLYNDIMNGNVGDADISSSIFDDEIDTSREDLIRKEKRRRKALALAYNTGLIEDESIVWMSDDYPNDVAPYFRIDKLDNAYRITFLINTTDRKLYGEEKDALMDYRDGFTSVRIRNDGSTYQMFNVPFMKAYNTLCEMELEEAQMHIAEYMLDKRLERGESLEYILTLKKDK